MTQAEEKLRAELIAESKAFRAGKLKTYSYEEMKKLMEKEMVRIDKKYAKSAEKRKIENEKRYRFLVSA